MASLLFWGIITIFIGLFIVGSIFFIVLIINVFKPSQGNKILDLRRYSIDGFAIIKKLYVDIGSRKFEFNSNKANEVKFLEQSGLFTKNVPIFVERGDYKKIKDAAGNNIVIAGWQNFIRRTTHNELLILKRNNHNLKNQLADIKYQFDLVMAKSLKSQSKEYLEDLAKLHNAVLLFPPIKPGAKK
jgi:hypothetical protein